MEQKRLLKLSRQFHKLKKGYHPASLQVALTDKCFNTCNFCEHWKRETHNKIKLEDWLFYLNCYSKTGLESVCYMGGDSLAYREINAVMDEHIKLDISFGFITTGYVPKFANHELLSYARWVRCSLDCITPKLYKKYRGGVPVEKVIDSILQMKLHGTNVEIYSAIQNETCSDMQNLVKFCLENKINLVFNKAEEGTANVDDLVDKKMIEIYDLYRNEFNKIKLDLQINTSGCGKKIYLFDKCNAVYYQLYITADGEIYPCCHIAGDNKMHPQGISLGNIKDSWVEISNNILNFSELKSNQRPDRCKICSERFQSINHISEQFLINVKNDFY